MARTYRNNVRYNSGKPKTGGKNFTDSDIYDRPPKSFRLYDDMVKEDWGDIRGMRTYGKLSRKAAKKQIMNGLDEIYGEDN